MRKAPILLSFSLLSSSLPQKKNPNNRESATNARDSSTYLNPFFMLTFQSFHPSRESIKISLSPFQVAATKISINPRAPGLSRKTRTPAAIRSGTTGGWVRGGLRRGGVWPSPGLTPSDSQSYPRQPHHPRNCRPRPPFLFRQPLPPSPPLIALLALISRVEAAGGTRGGHG